MHRPIFHVQLLNLVCVQLGLNFARGSFRRDECEILVVIPVTTDKRSRPRRMRGANRARRQLAPIMGCCALPLASRPLLAADHWKTGGRQRLAWDKDGATHRLSPPCHRIGGLHYSWAQVQGRIMASWPRWTRDHEAAPPFGFYGQERRGQTGISLFLCL
jgi:hypothetical protein